MSLLLMFFYWTIIPGLVLLAVLAGWRRAQTRWTKAGAAGAGAAALLGLLWLGVGRTLYYDMQVRELCAKDGGVRVYETVKLPAEKFNQWGQPNFRIPVTPYTKLSDTDGYYLEWQVTNLKRGNPNLERSHFRLIRRNDQKLLGESVSYSRGGGDLPGPWHGSSYICPEPAKDQSLESSIFVKGDKQ